MENFETDFDNNSCFEEIILAFSEDYEEIINISEDYPVDEIELNCEELSSSDMIVNIAEAFEKNAMNDHFATINLLGDLGYTDVLMYYCIVKDYLFINGEKDNKEQICKTPTPAQYISEKETIRDKVFEFELEFSRASLTKLSEVLKYLKTREFKVLSNTFYMDGSDFILFLSLKSVVGYNLRIKIVFKCTSLNEVAVLNERFGNLQNKLTAEGENDE